MNSTTRLEVQVNGTDYIRLSVFIALSVCVVLVAGCGSTPHDYHWAPYPIDQARVVTDGSVLSGRTVSITHEGNDGEKVMIGELGRAQYFSSNDQLAAAISIQLSDELKRLNMTVSGDSSKTLNIKVSHPATERGMWVIRANLRITVEAGNGYMLETPVSNASPMTVPRAFNGVVVFSVIEILNDPEIIEYLTDG